VGRALAESGGFAVYWQDVGVDCYGKPPSLMYIRMAGEFDGYYTSFGV
jgi:hypothetical protein